MKVTAIVTSPRAGGNCDVLTDEAIRGAEEKGAEVKKYFVQDLEVNPCQACGSCGDGIDCVYDDDMADILQDILDSDAVIFASPIYFGTINAQAKAVIDRFYSVFTNPQKEFSGKLLAIYTSGAPAEALIDAENMTTGLFTNLGFETTALNAGGVLPKGAAKEQEEYMKAAYEFGKGL